VLRAMGVSADDALATVRLSLGHTNTMAEVQFLLAQLPPLLAPLLRELAVPA
jgi:cysteine desulfurase